MLDVFIIGAGASGYFAAINLAESRPDLNVTILEKSNQVLGKVKISGGGRCNVTHSCFEPKELIKFYPRGGRELLGSFHSFQPENTVEWFQSRGVKLKTEEDGRMFPISDDSQTIISCFQKAADQARVRVLLKEGLTDLKKDGNSWLISTNENEYRADAVVLSAGSSTKLWKKLNDLGHQIIDPVPSLFTFHVKDKNVHKLAGLSLNDVKVKVVSKKSSTEGALLFTHWGFSASAILKLSAKEARDFHDVDYNFGIRIDFLQRYSEEELGHLLEDTQRSTTKMLYNHSPFDFPKRFWHYLLFTAEIEENRIWPELRKKEKQKIIALLKNMEYEVRGKSTFKEEFVTAGGVKLKEVNFKTMESKICPGVYFTGEILNIDGYTGGFNFQAAWTTAFIAAQAISKKV